MGASGWSYFVPYEADISVALQRLRQDVFDRGDYLTADDILNSMDWEAAAKKNAEWAKNPELSPDVRESYLKAASDYRKLHWGRVLEQKAAPAPKPRSIEELLEQEGENGTHSILDITCISARPKFAAISPFPQSKLVYYFNSDKPTHSVIEDRHEWGSLEKFTSKRWQGIYIVAYRDEKPNEIFFAGCSGD
jgi:hypothetical protein